MPLAQLFATKYTVIGFDINQKRINELNSGIDISISDLTDIIKHTAGFKGSFVYNISKPDGTMKKLTDVSKLKKLGWNHKVGIEKGIQNIYKWYIFKG